MVRSTHLDPEASRIDEAAVYARNATQRSFCSEFRSRSTESLINNLLGLCDQEDHAAVLGPIVKRAYLAFYNPSILAN